jgi:hypothetical protein
MRTPYGKGNQIRKFILDNVRHHPRDIVRLTEKTFQITRQAVYRHTHNLIGKGLLIAEGSTRKREYKLKVIASKVVYIPISEGLQEDVVWREQVSPVLSDVPQNIIDICNHGFTEMVNNVRDHSAGTMAKIEVQRTAVSIIITIYDDGVGIFKKIKDTFGLDDQRHAILELAKGKLTTDPEHHTGEGIFFTSRMFDIFNISSGGLHFLHGVIGQDILMGDVEEEKTGTLVNMEINIGSILTAKEVFDKYSDDDYGFTRTVIPVRLVKYGNENLVSRSQAKRLVVRFEKFREVILDFDRVENIGQAFADEIFRVFQQHNPQVHIMYINANGEVERSIKRAAQVGINALSALGASFDKTKKTL